jgi:hypothetical protein
MKRPRNPGATVDIEFAVLDAHAVDEAFGAVLKIRREPNLVEGRDKADQACLFIFNHRKPFLSDLY